MSAPRILYRPVGLKEALRILEGGATQFPPRRPEQPIFYPVLNFVYAEQIARDWNTKSPQSGFVGFVTRFRVDPGYVAGFAEHVVGARIHRELWVPAEELDEFNQHIIGRIEFIAAYYGDDYQGPLLDNAPPAGNSAGEQFLRLAQLHASDEERFDREIGSQSLAVQLHFAYWLGCDFRRQGLSAERKAEVLRAVSRVWRKKHPDVRLIGGEDL